MASFVPPDDNSTDPKFLNYFSSPSPDKPNQTGEVLTKGISSLFDSAVTGFDKLFEKNAKDQVKDIAKNADEMFGNNAAVKSVAEGTNPTDVLGGTTATGEGVMGTTRTAKGAPPGVDKLGARIASLDEAYKNGDLSNSKFQAWVEMETRKAISQYPEYEDKIRAEVRSRLGASPDELRKSLVSDLDAKYRAAAAGQDKVYNFITKESNMEAYSSYPGGPAQVIKDWKDGKIDLEKIYGIPYEYHSRLGQFKSEEAKIKWDIANKGAANEKMERIVGDYARGHVAAEINGFLDAPDIKNFLEKAKTNPNSVSADDVNAAKSVIRTYEQKIDQHLALIARGVNPADGKPLYEGIYGPDGKGTPEANLGETKMKNIIEGSKRYFNAIKAQVDSGKFDVVSAIREHGELTFDIQKGKMFDADKYYLNSAVLEKTTPELYKSIVNSSNYDKTVGDPWRNAGTRAFLTDIVTPQKTPPPTLTDAVKTKKELTKSENDSLKSNIYNGSLSVLLNPATKGPNFERAASAVYGPGNEDFMNQWTSNNHTKMYVQMTSDAFTTKMIEAGKNNPQVLQQYVSWAERNLGPALKPQIESLYKKIQEDPRLQVTWDTKYMQMSVDNTAAVKYGGARLPQDVQQSVFMMNASIANLRKAYEAAGKNPDSLYDTLRAAGMNVEGTEAANAGKKPSDIDKVPKAGDKTTLTPGGNESPVTLEPSLNTSYTNPKLSGPGGTLRPGQSAGAPAGLTNKDRINKRLNQPVASETSEFPKGFDVETYGSAMKRFPTARIDNQGRLVVNKDGKWYQIQPH